MRFSVIIASYNKQGYIEKTLLSILRQDFSHPFEIVVCDDGSTDDTPRLVAGLAESHDNIRLIANTENRGPSYAQQQAFKASCGELVLTFDADDIMMPGTLSRLSAAFDDPACEFAYGRHLLLDGAAWSDDLAGSCTATVISEPLKQHLKQQYANMVGTFRRAFFERIGGFDTRVFIQDLPVIRKVAAKASKGVFFDQVFSYTPNKRLSEVNLSTNIRQKKFDALLSEILFMTEYLEGRTDARLSTSKRLRKSIKYLELSYYGRELFISSLHRKLGRDRGIFLRSLRLVNKYERRFPVRVTPEGRAWIDDQLEAARSNRASAFNTLAIVAAWLFTTIKQGGNVAARPARQTKGLGRLLF